MAAESVWRAWRREVHDILEVGGDAHWSAVDIPMLSRMKPWKARLRFALRPIMLIDLLAVLPFYLQFLIPIDLRMLRVLRLFLRRDGSVRRQAAQA
jgi:hypothetical protein